MHKMESELCIDIINNYDLMQNLFKKLRYQLINIDNNLNAWFKIYSTIFKTAGDDANTREDICDFIATTEYLDGQLPREIIVAPGLVGASLETLQIIYALNSVKDKFKESVLALRNSTNNIWPNSPFLNEEFEKRTNKNLRINLNRAGLSRIHLKQCYRKIPVFDKKPSRVSWTWANTRSIKKISLLEAEQLLQKCGKDAGIERQIKLLQSLHPDEKLAIVQDLAPHLRANIVWENKQRCMVKGPVPIFFPLTTGEEFPIFITPTEKKGKNKDKPLRSDVKIEEKAFLPAIRAHKYLNYQHEQLVQELEVIA
jgi:hypothetical protein